MKKSRKDHLKDANASRNFRRATEILKDKGKLFENVVSSMEGGLTIVDRDMRIVFQNKPIIELFGDRVGEYCYKVYEGRDKICEGCPVKKAYRDGKFHKSLRVGQTAKGPFRAENIASVLRDDNGDIVAGMELCRFVEEDRQKLEDLRRSEKRFQDVALSSADWIWEVDKDGKYVFTSGKVKEILGYSAEELIGKTPFDLMPEEEAKRVGKIFKKIVAGKKPIVNLENWNISKDKRKVLLLTNGVPILDEKGNLSGYRGVDKDITESRKAEEELKRKNEELERFSKLAIGREQNMIDLKKKIKELEAKLKR